MDAIDLVVNGKPVRVSVPADTPLIFVLRNDLGLKGTRLGCGEGECQSCTVSIDGRPELACAVAVGAAAGRRIETVESLDGSAGRHPLLDAFLADQAGQCGYCLAGILMRAKALLERSRSPSRSEIAAALDGHLCRCGAHGRIIAAVERAAHAGRGQP